MTRTRQKTRKQAKAKPASGYESIDPIAQDKALARELWGEDDEQDATSRWILALFAEAILIAVILISVPQ